MNPNRGFPELRQRLFGNCPKWEGWQEDVNVCWAIKLCLDSLRALDAEARWLWEIPLYRMVPLGHKEIPLHLTTHLDDRKIPLHSITHLDQSEKHLALMGLLGGNCSCGWESFQSLLYCLHHEYYRRIQRLRNSKWAVEEEPRIYLKIRYMYIIRVTNNTVWHLADQCSQLLI